MLIVEVGMILDVDIECIFEVVLKLGFIKVENVVIL